MHIIGIWIKWNNTKPVLKYCTNAQKSCFDHVYAARFKVETYPEVSTFYSNHHMTCMLIFAHAVMHLCFRCKFWSWPDTPRVQFLCPTKMLTYHKNKIFSQEPLSHFLLCLNIITMTTANSLSFFPQSFKRKKPIVCASMTKSG